MNAQSSRVKSSRPIYWTIVLSLALLTACDKKDAMAPGPTGGTIVISTAADAEALIPPLVGSVAGMQVSDLLFDRLAAIGDSLNTTGDQGFTPQLAERWAWSADSLSIAFHLNPAARWHDGTPVRARDVVFTHQLYADPAVAAPSASHLSNIDSVTARDSMTAVFWFASKSARQFFDAVHHMHILPEHALGDAPRGQLRGAAFARAPVGSGRFRFAAWQPAVSIEIVADTANYRGRARVDRVIWTVAPDFTTASTKLLAGEADVFEQVRPEMLPDITKDTNLAVVTFPSLDYGFMQFNLRDPRNNSAPHPVFGERAARVAVSMALDRRALVRNVFDTLANVALGPTARGYFGADTTLPAIPHDVAGARRILDSLGWRDTNGDGIRERAGRRLAIKLTTPTSSRNRGQLAVLIQEQLRQIGMAVEIEAIDIPAFMTRQGDRSFDAMMSALHLEPAPGIRQTWGTPGAATSSGINHGSYANPLFDLQVDSALATTDPAAAKRHMRRALETIIADAPAVWLYEPVFVLAIHRRLRPTRVRRDAWWAGLADWTVDPDRRIDRDRIGLTPRR